MPPRIGIVQAQQALAGGAIRSLVRAFDVGLGRFPDNFFAERFPDLPAAEQQAVSRFVQDAIQAGERISADNVGPDEQAFLVPRLSVRSESDDGFDEWTYGVEIEWELPLSGRSGTWLIEVLAPLGTHRDDIINEATDQLISQIQAPGTPTFQGEDTATIDILDTSIEYSVRG